MMKKPWLLLITNTANDSAEDRDFLVPALSQWFDIQTAGITESICLLDTCDLYLLRNVWPFSATKNDLRALAQAIRTKGIPGCNPVRGNQFVGDKTCLAPLTREGWPVIPTVINKTDIEDLGDHERYVIKPIDGCSSEGVHIISSNELRNIELAGQILQPFIVINHEISFFFIDDVFVYALRTKSNRWDQELFNPDETQLAWAQKFADWNEMPHGLQRIDAAMQANGAMLLMEFEDVAPFLSLHRLPKELLQSVADKLAQSLLRRLK